jgi:hypothetical protein
MLEAIESTISRAEQASSKPVMIIMAGDFNRHHPAWSNRRVHHRFTAHAEELVNFFQIHRLQWCLPRGTSTYWSLNQPGKTSVLDLTVTNSRERLIRCCLHQDNYGSDHRATYSEWLLHPEHAADRKPRRMYERAEWEKIGQGVQAALQQPLEIRSKEDLERAVEQLISTTTTALDQHVPAANPSPYSKRWFKPELKSQQREVNQVRRRWQESCATRGPHHPHIMSLFTEMRIKRRAWTRTIEKAKAAHWKEFLDGAAEGHLWKAASYMCPQESYGNIPPLKTATEEVSDNEGKAKLLLDTFFPKTADPIKEDVPLQHQEIRWEPVTAQEIHRALTAAKGTTAPGEDGIPTLVWKQL